jgi:hypothetical protein
VRAPAATRAAVGEVRNNSVTRRQASENIRGVVHPRLMWLERRTILDRSSPSLNSNIMNLELIVPNLAREMKNVTGLTLTYQHASA